MRRTAVAVVAGLSIAAGCADNDGDGEPAADDTVARPSTSRSGWVMARPLRASSSASVRTSARHRGDRPGGASVRSSSGVVTSKKSPPTSRAGMDTPCTSVNPNDIGAFRNMSL